MSAVKRLHSRFVIYLVFVLMCLRTMLGRILPGESTKPAGRGNAQPASAQPLLLHSGNTANDSGYALQPVGVFPYVKLVPISARAVPVPMEVMGQPGEEKASKKPGLLVHRAAQTSSAPQELVAGFVSTSCSSCFCGSCSCFDCSSCFCSSCTCA